MIMAFTPVALRCGDYSDAAYSVCGVNPKHCVYMWCMHALTMMLRYAECVLHHHTLVTTSLTRDGSIRHSALYMCLSHLM